MPQHSGLTLFKKVFLNAEGALIETCEVSGIKTRPRNNVFTQRRENQLFLTKSHGSPMLYFQMAPTWLDLTSWTVGLRKAYCDTTERKYSVSSQ